MYNRCSLLFSTIHLLSWIRSEVNNTNPDVLKLFNHSGNIMEKDRSNLDQHFSEGGAIEIPKNNFTQNLTNHGTLEDHHLEELPLGAARLVTSSIKARTGVELPGKIFARKGVDFNLPFFNVSQNQTIMETTIPIKESTPSPERTSTLVIDSTASSKLVTTPNTYKTTLKHKKPTITTVPLDSDAFLKSLKSDRNVVVPVLFLIFIPIVVLLALLVYKRIQESRGTHYTRMGFLIEDIYND